ncbi:hypothetical protein LR48_Vigan04g131500 [Vigna angularis]|uniref:Aminotransferase-like plant mobile domain-containing protein n=1 Tax=Phaseolus angularis TaxID=3914 RepID=A0A0L9UEY5_PHAAN|nr:hypothetical protein LR48_Vigan04g131500 [Vigna angularis]
MVKPRGGYHGEASSSHSEPSDERRRPTASARRRRVEEYRVDVIHEHDNEEQEELLQHGHSQDDYVEEEDIQQQHDCSQEEHEGEGEDEDEDEVEDGGFPGGPHDTSLLTHYTQHVAFAIWQGRSWIYEHFPTMGRRQVSKRYTELDPRASRYIPPRVGWSLTRGRTFLDALSYDVVIWNPYLSHRRTCPLIAIIMYLGWIRLGDMIHRHLPERVLRQFGFQQNIPRSPDSLPMPDIPTIDLNWLRYAEHAITSVIEADQSHACVDGYITWFRRVSHPYITPGNDDERPSLAPLMRRDIPDERLVPPVRRRRSAELGLLEGMRRVIRMLQGMLTYRDVTEGTVAYQRTTETLQVARRSVEEYESSTRRGGRHVRGRASFS